MSYGAAGLAGAGGVVQQQAAVAHATRAMGPIVELEADDWLELVDAMPAPVVLHATRKAFKLGSWPIVSQAHRYLSPFYGLLARRGITTKHAEGAKM